MRLLAVPAVLALAVGTSALAGRSSTAPADAPNVDRLLTDLVSDTAAVRLAAARALRQVKEARVLAALSARVGVEGDAGVNFEILRSLVKLGDVPARRLLETYTLTEFWQVNLYAARDLIDAGDTQAVRLMTEEGLGHRDPAVTDAVLQALRLVNAPETMGLLEKAVREDPGSAAAAHLAAFVGGANARALLLGGLERGSTAPGAAQGLAVIAEPALVAELERRLLVPASAEGAALALSQIGGPRAVKALFDALDDRAHPEAARAALQAIIQQSFGFGVPRYERRRGIAWWRDWWKKTGASAGGFENVTIPAGLAKVRGIGHRVTWGDFDGDGYDDLLVTGRYLFLNDRRGGFVDATERAGLSPAGLPDALAAVAADYNNDGRLDCYVVAARDHQSRLMRNQGDGTFLDVTADAGQVTSDQSARAAGWADVDRDGNLDLLVAYALERDSEPGAEGETGLHPRLYRSRGDGTFADVTRASGFSDGPPREARGLAWADFDNDGDLDCYIANGDYQPNALWLNRGDATFADVAQDQRAAGRAHSHEGRELFGRSQGCAWGDFNNDGWLDLFVANVANPDLLLFSDQSLLLENRVGAGRDSGVALGFRDVRAAAGISYEETHAGCAWGDYDNDGDLDLVITSSLWRRRSYLYRNNGDGTFEDVTWATGARVLEGGGCAWADYDRDGRLDLVLAGDYGVRLFHNVTANGNKWLQVDLTGTRSNRSAIGARITVTAGAMRQIREVSAGRGGAEQDSLVQHFGLGPNPPAVQVQIRWPNGAVQTIENVAPDQRLKVTEPK